MTIINTRYQSLWWYDSCAPLHTPFKQDFLVTCVGSVCIPSHTEMLIPVKCPSHFNDFVRTKTFINESKSVKIHEKSRTSRNFTEMGVFHGRLPISRKMSRPWNRELGWSLDIDLKPDWKTASKIVLARKCIWPLHFKCDISFNVFTDR